METESKGGSEKRGKKITPRTLVCALNQFFSPFRPCPRTCVCDTHTHTHTNTLTQQVHSKKKKTQALTDMISPSVRSFCSTRQNFNIKTKTNTEREREPKLFILKIKRNVSEGGWQNVAGIVVFFPSVQYRNCYQLVPRCSRTRSLLSRMANAIFVSYAG